MRAVLFTGSGVANCSLRRDCLNVVDGFESDALFEAASLVAFRVSNFDRVRPVRCGPDRRPTGS